MTDNEIVLRAAASLLRSAADRAEAGLPLDVALLRSAAADLDEIASKDVRPPVRARIARE